MRITQEMINDLNKILNNKGSNIKLKPNDISSGNPTYKVSLSEDKFLHSYVLNPSKDFFEFVNDYFMDKGIKVVYNNNGNTFWSHDGWNEM